MRIGIFTDTYTPNINGVVSSIVTLEKGLKEAGHEVYIITSYKGFIHSEKEGNVFRLPGMELKWLYGYILSTPYHFTVKAEVEKLNLDIIHVHTEFGVGMFGRIVARSLNLPVVYTYHTMYEDYTHYINMFDLDTVEKGSKKAITKFSKFLCNSVSSIIAPSEKTKEALERYGVQRPIHIIPTGLDLDRFKKENVSQEICDLIKARYQIKDDEKIITYVGRIAEEKSIDMIIDAMVHVENTHCRMMIVGGGPALDDLKAQAKSLGVENRIIFTGAVAREEVSAYYQISNAFVSASTTETQGMTFIEALASGLCVFARPDEEALEGLIVEGENGYYFEDAKMFAQKLDAYFSAYDTLCETIESNALKVVEKYDIHTFTNAVSAVYEKAIEDYEECFIVRSIKSNHECMKLYLDNKKYGNEETVLISLEDYMFYQIKKDEYIERFTFDILKDRERMIVANRLCIKQLRSKDRTRKEMYDYLIQQDKVKLTIKEINQLIENLEKKGYINDEAYMVMAISKMDHHLVGKKKMLRKLIEKGIPYDDANEKLEGLDEDGERYKAEKQARKYMENIHNKSVSAKKQMIIDKLCKDGFPYEMAKDICEQLNFEDDILNEIRILNQVIDKVAKNYAKKYEGKELRRRIIQYALNKGFVYEDIVHVLEEREADDE